MIRCWKGNVAAQDIKGEYGRLHHQITTKAIAKSVTNRYSSARFGLYYSTVGPDVIGQDMFENIE